MLCDWFRGTNTAQSKSANTHRRMWLYVYLANTKHLYNICTMLDQRLPTLVQYWTNLIQMFCVCWVPRLFISVYRFLYLKQPQNVNPMLYWCSRWWFSIKTTWLGLRVLFFTSCHLHTRKQPYIFYRCPLRVPKEIIVGFSHNWTHGQFANKGSIRFYINWIVCMNRWSTFSDLKHIGIKIV